MTIPMSDIISRARILSSKIFEQVVAAVSLRNRPIGQSSPSKTGHREFKIKCIRCGGAHLIKNHTERVGFFQCNKFGHIASNCEQDE